MDLITYMKHERSGKLRGIYWLFQINMAFNSNKIEGNQLSFEQTQYLFDEKRIYTENGESIALDDIQETINHFRTFDYILENVEEDIDITMLKELHYLLQQNTSAEENPLNPVGKFKPEINVIGLAEIPTTHPDDVEVELSALLKEYLSKKKIHFEDLVDFHVKFERIHPFADGNGRIGRLIAFKESLKHNIVPSVILNKHRHFYMLGLKEYDDVSKLRLLETFRAGQDYSEQVLKKLEFEGNINNRIKENEKDKGYEL